MICRALADEAIRPPLLKTEKVSKEAFFGLWGIFIYPDFFNEYVVIYKSLDIRTEKGYTAPIKIKDLFSN